MKTLVYLSSLLLIFLTACSSLVLTPADFSWPVESVLNIDNDGNVAIERYSESFNTKNLFYKETGDSLAYQNQQLRVIRSKDGYYFMVANNFKNVYMFNEKDGAFRLEKKISVSESAGLQNPAFNQRSPFIELVYGENSAKKIDLTQKGINKEER
jgi:hypothetical protein